MNSHQLQQYVFNNLWFGENQRSKLTPDDNEAVFFSTALLQPNYFRPWGLDDSHWGGILDLERAKSLGMAFAFFKGMDGTIETRYFRENFTEAARLQIDRAPYQWLYRNANVSCVAQAQALDNLCNLFPPTLPAVIDFEATRYGGAPSNPDFTDLRKWAVEWLRLGNPKPLLYSGKYYMDGFGQMPADLKDMFAGLWLARYWPNNDPPLPALPLGWVESELLFTQWTASGDQEFIAPSSVGKLELDLNYRLGDTAPPPPTGGTMQYVTGTVTASSGLNVRVSPATGTTILGVLPFGAPVAGWLENGWIKIQYNNADGYVSAEYVNDQPATPPAPAVTVASIDVDFAAKTLTLAYSDGTQRVEGIA